MVAVHFTETRWEDGHFVDAPIGSAFVSREGIDFAGESRRIAVMVDAVSPPAVLRLVSPHRWATRLAARFDRPQVSATVQAQPVLSSARQSGRVPV